MSHSRTRSRRVYLALGLLFLISIAITQLRSLSEFARVVFALPAAVALCGAVLQLLRDQLIHDRAVEMQVIQNSFGIGATSHMATVAFDKHVLFCEAYVAETFNTLVTLFQRGPTKDALSHAGKLYDIRQNSILWLTPAIEVKLDKFEAALREIGADAHFVDVAIDHPDRPRRINEMYSLFAEVMGMKTWQDQPVPSDRAIMNVIQWLREMLGIDELTALRQALIADAHSSRQK